MSVKVHLTTFIFFCFFVCMNSMADDRKLSAASKSGIRVPAEWEAHAATWMQWPDRYDAEMRPAFADIIDVIQAYEPVHLLTRSAPEKAQAKRYLSRQGVSDTNIIWHIVPLDNAWMRDNGPVYVTDGVRTWIQNWGFDAWGGNFGEEVGYHYDDRIPTYVGEQINMTVVDYQDYVLERGNLEFNGAGILILNWDCQDDRNPGMTQAEHEAILKKAFGVTKIIWAYGHHPEDGTTGHIDGAARFIDRDTLVIADTGMTTEQNLAIAAEEAGLEVILYPGDPNWLVGNGFVVAMGEGDSDSDAELKLQLRSFFPDRDIYLVDASSIAASGGGIHCVTNDQPALP